MHAWNMNGQWMTEMYLLEYATCIACASRCRSCVSCHKQRLAGTFLYGDEKLEFQKIKKSKSTYIFTVFFGFLVFLSFEVEKMLLNNDFLLCYQESNWRTQFFT